MMSPVKVELKLLGKAVHYENVICVDPNKHILIFCCHVTENWGERSA